MKLVNVEQCSATARTTKKRCGRPAIPGGKVCRVHGGAAPQVKAKAAERITERELRDTLGRLDITPVADPLTELQQLAGQVVAWKQLLADRVAALKSTGYEGEYGEQIRADVTLFERALDQCRRVLVDIARLNIDERLVALDEKRVALVAEALDRALGDLGLTREQRQEARSGVARHLRIVAG